MSKEEAKQNDNFHIDKGSVSCNLCVAVEKHFIRKLKQQPIRKAIQR